MGIRLRNNSGMRNLTQGMFANATNIKVFELENNGLEYLPPDAFKIKSGESTEILLLGNSIGAIDREVFILPPYDNQTEVTIRLTGQDLQMLDKQVFQGLLNSTGASFIDSSENPIACDCSISWLFDSSPTSLSYISRVWGTCKDGTRFQLSLGPYPIQTSALRIPRLGDL